MTEMRKTGLILIALLLFLAGCSYFPDQAVHVVDMDRAPVSEAASEYPPSVESAILTDLERSLRVDPDSKLQIVTLEVGADWVSLRVSAPKGMALSLAHGGSDTAASWTASCGALATLSRKASDICAEYGRDSDAVSAFLLNDTNRSRALYALRDGSVLYDVKADRAPERSVTYVLNTSTMRIHNTWCPSVKTIKAEHIRYTTQSLSDLLDGGYIKCGQRGDWDKAPSDFQPSDTVGRPLNELEEVTAP